MGLLFNYLGYDFKRKKFIVKGKYKHQLTIYIDAD